MASAEVKEGFRYLIEGKHAEAVAAFQRVLAQGDDGDALLGLARAQLAQREFGRARKALERLIALDPTRAEAHSHLAFLDAANGDADAVERLRELSTSARAGFYEHFNLGLVLASLGELEQAEQALTRAVNLEPKSFHALLELGQLALKRGAHDVAIERFTRAADAAPTRSLPLALLARVHLAKGEKGKALRALTAALARAPTEKPLYEQLIRVCLDAGAPKQAAAAAAELRRLDATNPRYLTLHAEATLALGKPDEARRLYQSAVDAAELPEALLGLARAHRALKDDEQAEAVLSRLLRAHPSDPGGAVELSRLLLARGDDARAGEVLRSALEAHPEDPGVHLAAARAMLRADRSAAIAHARKAATRGEPDIRDQAEALLREA